MAPPRVAAQEVPSPVTAPRPGVLILTPLPVKNPAEDGPESPPAAPGSTVPDAAGRPLDDDMLWLVSFDDDDDRELRPGDIAAALRRGEIARETIVWREGLADWAPIGSIPSLARLLPSSGETATAPLVASPHAAGEPVGEAVVVAASSIGTPVPRLRGNEPVKPPSRAPDQAAPENIEDAESATQPITTTAAPASEDEKPPPGASNAPDNAWRGKTRLGLPTPAAPKTGTGTPKAPSAGHARTPEAPKVGGGSKGGAASIWDDEDDEPISVDPESIRPLSPTPNMVNATALARGTLGELPRKPPPRAPRPPGAQKPASPSSSGGKPPPPRQGKPPHANTETPPIAALAGSSRSGERADEDFLNLGSGGGMSAAMLAPPLDLASAFGDEPVFRAESPPLDSPDVLDASDVEETATVPTATEVARRPAVTPATSSGSKATPAAPSAKKRSLVPFLLGGVAVVYVLSVGARKLGQTETSPSAAVLAQEPPSKTAPEPAEKPAAAEPEPAPVAAVPEAPSAAAPGVTTTQVVGSKNTGTPKASQKTEPASTTANEPKKAATNAESAKKPEPVAAAEPEPKQVDMGGDFDKTAASAALGAAAGQAASCRKQGDPAGVATVHVTFTNSGHATRATIEGPPFAGTATGGCIAAALRSAKVPPFGGDRVTVTKHVVIE
jgi:hypothetical protein